MICVTGAGGFIGSHLCTMMTSAGYAVRPLFGPGDTIADPAQRPIDLGAVGSGSSEVRDVLRGAEAIVHLAGPPSVAASFRDPVATVDAHVTGTARILEAAREEGVDRFVHLSSAEVYGLQAVQPVPESACPAPRSPYAAAKVAAEALVTASVRAGWTSGTILRAFSVYGPGQGDHSLLAELISSARAGDVLSVRDPEPRRDYVWVDDVCRAVMSALEHTGDEPLVCNIASGKGHTVRDVARLVAREFGLTENPEVLGASRPADIPILVGDTTLAVQALGLGEPTHFGEGIAMLLERDGRDEP